MTGATIPIAEPSFTYVLGPDLEAQVREIVREEIAAHEERRNAARSENVERAIAIEDQP